MLGRSLDELPPQTRRLLLLIEQMVVANAGASRWSAAIFVLAAATYATHTGWGDTQLKVHLHRLKIWNT